MNRQFLVGDLASGGRGWCAAGQSRHELDTVTDAEALRKRLVRGWAIAPAADVVSGLNKDR